MPAPVEDRVTNRYYLMRLEGSRGCCCCSHLKVPAAGLSKIGNPSLPIPLMHIRGVRWLPAGKGMYICLVRERDCRRKSISGFLILHY